MWQGIPIILWFAMVGVATAADGPVAAPIREPGLRLELLRRAKADQEVRGAVEAWMARHGNAEIADEAAFEASLDAIRRAEFRQFASEMRRVDEENTGRLGEIVDRHGWPTATLVGKDGANAAWLLVQHADRDPKFQRKCLDLMAKAPRDEISRKDLAYLTDRVLMAEGKNQVYGTQFTLKDGRCEPRPLEDAANVDARRKDVGLPPLAEYLKEAEGFYGRNRK